MSSHGRHQPRRENDTRKSSSSTSSLKSHERSRRRSTSISDDGTSSSAEERSRSRKRSAVKERRSGSGTATSKKRKRHHRSRSSSTSDDSSAKHSKKCKAKKKKKKRKHKKDKKSKSAEAILPTKIASVDKAPAVLKTAVSDDELIGPAADSMNTKNMKPMSKEEWEKKQSVIRKVYDPETGRHRLIRGDGEVLEEIVSHNQHKEINKKSTDADGAHFQHMLGIKNPV